MAKIILSSASRMGRLAVGRDIITREESCEISALRGLLRLGDPNLSITFEESDREELENLSEKILVMATRILQLEEIPTGKELASALLPKPKVTTRAKNTAKKAAKKAKEVVAPTTEEVEDSEDSE